MNVVLYLRYSSDRQTEQSIEGQQRVCREYCARNGMTIVGEYVDRALSAAKNTEKREMFLRMIRDSERRQFEAVVVYKLDRFSRNRYDSATYKNKLKKNGVRVVSATENISDNPEGVILESVLEGMAEFYSKELSQKVTRGMHETALKGNSCGGQIPLGYRIVNKKFVLDELTAPIVKEAFDRYASGERAKDIVDDFNRRGFRTSRGYPFAITSLTSMLGNERYVGIYTYKDVRTEGAIPAIVTKEIFDVVQRRRQKNKKAPAMAKAVEEYLLSGKLFCGHCGRLMSGVYGTNHAGKKYAYYRCYPKNGCAKKNVRKDAIEMYVAMEAKKLLNDEKIEEIAAIAVREAERDKRENSLVPAIRKQIGDIQKSITNLIRFVENGAESESIFERIKELEREKKDAEKRLSEEERNFVQLKKEHISFWLSQFKDGDINDIDFRRRLIDMLVHSVTVWDDPDGYYTITTLYNLTSCSENKVNGLNLDTIGPPRKSYSNIFVVLGVVFGITRNRVRL